jgi:putative copper export protein
MPEYRNPQILQGVAANQEASRIFDETAARKQSEEYTGTTVVLATVLFLVALSPRFRSRRVRFVLLLLTGGLAVYALATILTFPPL